MEFLYLTIFLIKIMLACGLAFCILCVCCALLMVVFAVIARAFEN